MLTAGLMLLLTGQIPVYSFLLFAMISRVFYQPFLELETHWANYLMVMDSFRRIKKITEAETVPEPEHPRQPTAHAISFENVSFSYEAGGFAMEDISFHTPEHTLTALVGASGSGKTTLSRCINGLVPRFYKGDFQGEVYLNGKSTADFTLRDFGRRVGSVF